MKIVSTLWLAAGVQVFLLVSTSGITTHQHLCVVHSLTLLFEGEVFREMPALVVASEQEECARVVDLQRPQEQHALQRERAGDMESMLRDQQNSARPRTDTIQYI